MTVPAKSPWNPEIAAAITICFFNQSAVAYGLGKIFSHPGAFFFIPAKDSAAAAYIQAAAGVSVNRPARFIRRKLSGWM